MAGPILKTCCLCQSLRTGSIISGVAGILLAIASLVVMFTLRVEFRTIFFDFFPSWVVKIILAINLCMTIFISVLLIVGVLKVYFDWFIITILFLLSLMFKIASEITTWCCHGLCSASRWPLVFLCPSSIRPWSSSLIHSYWPAYCGSYLVYCQSVSIYTYTYVYYWEKYNLFSCNCCVVIYVYMWMVVYSHFTEIREEAQRGRYNKQPYRR